MTLPPIDHARQILDTLLGYLGFAVRIEEEEGPEGPALQVFTEDHDALVGPQGEVLDDLQYLVNRILQRRDPAAPRVRVDVEYFRSMREDRMMEKVREVAERVRATGQSAALPPMNSYYRRIVHNLFVNDPGITSESEGGSERFKRVILKRKRE